MANPEQTVKNQDNLGRFVKGNKSNPTGANGYTTVRKIEEALENKAKQCGYKDFSSYVAERVLINDAVLMAVLKKLIPDKLQGEGFGNSGVYIYIVRDKPAEGCGGNRVEVLAAPESAGDKK